MEMHGESRGLEGGRRPIAGRQVAMAMGESVYAHA